MPCRSQSVCSGRGLLSGQQCLVRTACPGTIPHVRMFLKLWLMAAIVRTTQRSSQAEACRKLCFVIYVLQTADMTLCYRCRNDVFHLDLDRNLVLSACNGDTDCINARAIEWRFLDSTPETDLSLPSDTQFAWHCRVNLPWCALHLGSN